MSEKEDRWRQVIPIPPSAVTPTTQPLYDKYKQGADALARVSDAEVAAEVLAASQAMFDSEIGRRASIDARVGTVLGASGLLGAVVVAAAQFGFSAEHPHLTGCGIAAVVFYFATLLFIAGAVLLCLASHGHRRGYIVSPEDLVPNEPAATGPGAIATYRSKRASYLADYTAENFKVDALVMLQLTMALRSLRNGVVCLIVAGALLPFATSTSNVNPIVPQYGGWCRSLPVSSYGNGPPPQHLCVGQSGDTNGNVR